MALDLDVCAPLSHSTLAGRLPRASISEPPDSLKLRAFVKAAWAAPDPRPQVFSRPVLLLNRVFFTLLVLMRPLPDPPCFHDAVFRIV